MSLLLSPLLSLLDPRGVFLGCRPFKPSDFVRSFGFRSCCCLFCLFWIRGVCSYVAGLSSPATSFAPSVSATISLFFYVLSSCSSSFFCASSGSFFIFGASCLFSAYGYFGFSLLRSRGAMVVRGFRERRRLRLPMRCRGVVCLIRFRQAYILTRLHFRGGGGGGGGLTTEFVLRLRVPFEKCYHLLPLSFLTFYLWSLNPPHFTFWFQGFGEERRKEPLVYLSYLCRMGKLWLRLFAR